VDPPVTAYIVVEKRCENWRNDGLGVEEEVKKRKGRWRNENEEDEDSVEEDGEVKISTDGENNGNVD
jgi:hypothetical protein